MRRGEGGEESKSEVARKVGMQRVGEVRQYRDLRDPQQCSRAPPSLRSTSSATSSPVPAAYSSRVRRAPSLGTRGMAGGEVEYASTTIYNSGLATHACSSGWATILSGSR